MNIAEIIRSVVDAQDIDSAYAELARSRAEWPARACRAADEAFVAYALGQASRKQFESVRDMADDACREGVPVFNRTVTRLGEFLIQNALKSRPHSNV